MRTPEEFKQWLNSPAVFAARRWSQARSVTPAPQHVGPIAGFLDDICGGQKERHSFLRYVFGVDSLNKLNALQLNSLWAWLSPAPLADGTWGPLAQCKHWAGLVVRAAIIDAGQMELIDVSRPDDSERAFVPGQAR